MTAEVRASGTARPARFVVALAVLVGCGGERPPADQSLPAAADSAVEAISDTAADSVMARDTAQ